jgi:hypothetical protein
VKGWLKGSGKAPKSNPKASSTVSERASVPFSKRGRLLSSNSPPAS